MTEIDIQNAIRLACTDIAVLFRVNVGSGRTADGNYFSTGVPAGYPDLSGFRISDGKAVYIEVKRPGGRLSKSQKRIGNALSQYPVIYGVAYSAEEARNMILGG